MIRSLCQRSFSCVAMIGLSLCLLASPFSLGDALAGGMPHPGAIARFTPEHASPVPPLPREFSLARVLGDSHMAGQRMQLWQLRAPIETRVAHDRIVAIWREGAGARVIEQRHGAWLIASRLTDGGLEVLQLRAQAKEAEGFLTLWHSAPPLGRSALTELLPSGFRSGHPLRTLEGNRWVSSVSAEVDAPIEVARRRLDRHLEAFDFKPAVLADAAGEATIVRYLARDRDLTVLVRGSGQRSHFAFTLSEIQP